MPAIVKFPGTQTSYKPGSINRSFSTCMDIAPTLLELAGIAHPAKDVKHPLDKAPYRDTMVYPMRGKSLVPYFVDGKALPVINGEAQEGHGDRYAVHPSDEITGWELFGQAARTCPIFAPETAMLTFHAVRRGRFKLVHEPKQWGGNAEGDEGWQLYDLVADPAERDDLSDKLPDVKAEMVKHWDEYVKWSGTGALLLLALLAGVTY